MAQFQFLGDLPDEIIDSIREKIIDPHAQNQIGRFRTALTKKAQELNALNRRTGFIRKKQAEYMDMLNNTLTMTGQYGNIIIEQNALAQQRKVIQELFYLIHNILDYLSSNKTATTEYAIYYNTDDQRETGTFIRREVSAKTLYGADVLTVTPGGIMLPRSALSKLFGKLNKLENQVGNFQVYSTSSEAYTRLAQEAINAITDLFHSMDSELGELSDTAKKEHLGEERWQRYLYYRKISNWGSEAQKLYNRYMMTSQYGNLRKAPYSRGHIGEAFERYLQEGGTDWTQKFKASLGRLPWYAGGDIGTTQVKTLFTSTAINENQYTDPSVQVASMTSILALTNELLIFLNMRASGKNDIKKLIKQQIENDLIQENVEEKLQKVLDSNAERKILQLFKDTMK